MTKLEQRVAELEQKVDRMEERRRRLVPAFIDNDPNVQELMADACKSAVARWEQCLAERNVSIKQARFLEAKAQALRELEQLAKEEKEREAAKFCAAVQFYERTGQSPPGYDFIEDDFENTSSTSLQRWEPPAGESEQ
jgi:hypothetical protein